MTNLPPQADDIVRVDRWEANQPRADFAAASRVVAEVFRGARNSLSEVDQMTAAGRDLRDAADRVLAGSWSGVAWYDDAVRSSLLNGREAGEQIAALTQDAMYERKVDEISRLMDVASAHSDLAEKKLAKMRQRSSA